MWGMRWFLRCEQQPLRPEPQGVARSVYNGCTCYPRDSSLVVSLYIQLLYPVHAAAAGRQQTRNLQVANLVAPIGGSRWSDW